MKKTSKWGGAILLTALLLAAGCDNAAELQTEDALNDGKLAIRVSNITGGDARAMTVKTAKEGVNYFEVIFYDGTDYTRTSWYKGQSARLAVPPANYDGDTSVAGQPATGKGWAILLAGTNNAGTAGTDFTLLAVGHLTGTNTDGSNTFTDGQNVTAATKAVQFTLYALEATPSEDKNKTNFAVTGGTGATLTSSLTTIPVATINGTKIPYFSLPKDTDNITAVYNIRNLDIAVPAGGSNKLGTYLKFAADPGVLTSVGVFSEEGDSGVTLVEGAKTVINTVTSDFTSTPAKIGMKIETPDEDGFSVLQIDAQVMGLDPAIPDGIVWHIRGGLFNYQLDSLASSASSNTRNGGILLAIGAKSGGININIKSPVVNDIAITPANLTIAKGLSFQFTAVIDGEGLYDDRVVWELSGNNKAGTTLSQTGLLTVASDEDGTLQVKVTMIAYPAKSKTTTTITLTP